VIDGKDERTGQPVVQRMMEQWFFSITRYADELLVFDGIDWPEPIRTMQTNWIGRSEGARVRFGTATGDDITVFTTRPDTLWGATFMVLAPEHPLVDRLTTDDRRAEVERYRGAASRRTELERLESEADKTGLFTGGYAVNPVNGEEIPVWIADYVLISYGTGAIMAVPAHDQRDFEFARKFGLTVKPVIHPEESAALDGASMTEAYVGPGRMVDSGAIDGVATTDAKGRANPSIAAAIDWLEEHGAGDEAIVYRLRDWLISRQRYWGAPIPAYHVDGGLVAVPESELPVVLPEDVEFDGRSPLGSHPDFVDATAPGGHPARRETDTMDTFMCSSWYWFRYLSPRYEKGPFDPEEAAYWLPVDLYTGGSEHAVMHLLYARFFQKAMRDMGLFDEVAAVASTHGRDADGLFDEPFMMLRNQGQILGEERSGDRVAITGDHVEGRFVARAVAVGYEDRAGEVVGEVMRRTENTLQVLTDSGTVTVEVPVGAAVDIAGIPGDNDVNQIKHHLEVQRMSKSKGNVVNPDDLVQRYGADTVRTYLMFAFEWQKGGPWDSRGIIGARRFIEDVYRLGTLGYAPSQVSDAAEVKLVRQVHQTIIKVESDLGDLKWNTAVAALMSLRNELNEVAKAASVSAAVWTESVETLLKLLAPIAPHVTEELWRATHDGSIHTEVWPVADPDLARDDVVTMVVQVNGKVRDRIDVPSGITAEEAETLALASEKVQAWTEAGVRKVIVRPPGLVNVVS
ncbi:MAG: leucine--tRNA ligase, partial [Acidimicrobiia bacterium]|nr:leucine--tRNA ligase [Acidimicrobiia bacterium]